MNNQDNQAAQKSNQFVGLLNLESFELSQRVANMLAHSTLVPEQYRAVIKVKVGKDQWGNIQYREEPNPSGLSNCIIALNMSQRMGADALMVMQNLYLIEGRPSWSSQFIMGAINSCGRFGHLRYHVAKLGEKTVEYTETFWENNNKRTANKKLTINDQSCIAWTVEKGTTIPNFSIEDLQEHGDVYHCCKHYGIPILESSEITIEMAVKEGWFQKKGSKWQTMPEQMLKYRASSFFGRVYAPELLMGLRSAEEEQDAIVDVTPEPEVKNTTGQVRALKQKILAAKTGNDLDKLEGELAELSESDWPEVNKLFNAQRDKLQGEIVDAEFVEEEVLKAEPVVQQEPEKNQPERKQTQAVESENVQKPASKDAEKLSSIAIRKEYLLKMNKVETLAELNEIHSSFLANDGLTGTHLSYLKDTYTQLKQKFTPPVKEEPKATVAGPDPIKSNSVKAGLERMIAEAKDVVSLEAEVARTIKGNESKLTKEHNQAVLMAYAHRKEVLLQQDIFEDGLSLVDTYLQSIDQAESIDRLNEIMSDPAVNSLPDDETAQINNAYDRRYAELQG
ncbi:hypothetical protein F974_01890 [Acinetobacter sp. CIP 102159]|uniref:hypothetical protein n=1 Tax=Acinetobacter sp. CIP 102159 TaxID=1144667 RepID=UPI0002CF911B|nr:hypothetical protein [Acinetobacter sp. CIP 102159]ENU83058.1 hypothetical protein F974_01890 [Acinetobacter sp. CIP 102159]